MKAHRSHHLHKPARTALWALVLSLVLVSSACATFSGTYGTLRRSEEVNNTFYEYRVMEGHTYYYTGSENRPDAIIALADGWSLQSSLWAPMKGTHENLSRIVYNMSPLRGYPHSPYGSWILDNQGNRIGAWFSRYDVTTVKIIKPGVVNVYPPSGTPNMKMGIFNLDD